MARSTLIITLPQRSMLPQFRVALNPAPKYSSLPHAVRFNLPFTFIQSNAFAENRFGRVVKQQSLNQLLMEFSEFTSGFSV